MDKIVAILIWLFGWLPLGELPTVYPYEPTFLWGEQSLEDRDWPEPHPRAPIYERDDDEDGGYVPNPKPVAP